MSNYPDEPGQLDLVTDQLAKQLHSLSYIVGDVRSQEYERIRIIPHCCNDIPAMGAGVAKALYEKWPAVKQQYMAHKSGLGEVHLVPVEYDDELGATTYVANMIGQHGVGKDEYGRAPIRYLELAMAMHKLVQFIDLMRFSKVEIHCPKFGSALAGGNWEFVEALIKEIWLPHFPVLVCCFNESEVPTI